MFQIKIKFTIPLFFIAILLLLPFNASLAEENFSWGFEVESNSPGWLPSPDLEDFSVANGALKARLTGAPSYFISPPYLNIPPDQYSIFEIRMKSNSSFNEGRIFWNTPGDRRFYQARSIAFSLGTAKKFHTHFINLKKNPLWTGNTFQLLVLPQDGPGEIEIDYIRCTPPSFLTLFKAGWQEFFTLESIKGRTVNTIMGQTINGKNINVYIYTIICLFLAALIIKELIFLNKSGLATFLLKVREKRVVLITVALLFMIALEVRLWLDYSRIAFLDFHNLWGKSLDEKREITTGGGFYEFMNYAQKVLPKEADVSLIVPSDFHKQKGPYYLYPHRVLANAPYIVVYHQDPGSLESDYVLFAEFREKEYILKARQ